MSNTDPNPAVAREKGARSKIEMIMLFGWGALLIFSLTRSCGESPRFLKPVVNAEPYVWPEGCKKRTYERGDSISINCFPEKYRIYDWYDRGLSRPSRTPIDEAVYYRVNNDAIDYICSWGDRNRCSVLDKKEQFFVVENRGAGNG
jgi:hypothetical protein